MSAMIVPNNTCLMTDEEMTYLDGGGLLTVYYHIGRKTRGRGALAAGWFAAGATAGSLSGFAATGPIQAGAVAVLSGIVGSTVTAGLKRGLKVIPVQTAIKELPSARFDVYLP